MTSVRVNYLPESFGDDDKLTYPTIVGNRIVEMTARQRTRLVEKAMTLDERVARLEERLRLHGLM